MSAPAFPVHVTVEEYLAGEARSSEKHDYVDGAVYAMAGASETHNTIAANLLGMLYAQLRGKPCQPFGSDMKVWVRATQGQCFYYPDAMVACDPTDSGRDWRERPAAIFEIISEETRRVDEREKRFMYFNVPGLRAYVRLEQARFEAVIERPSSEGWLTERIAGTDAVLRLPELDLALPLTELYDRVRLSA
jgi:Uma2 family endonuclease